MRCWYFWFAATIAVGCLAIPLRYRIPCNCQIEPVTRRFVAAPHDGLFEKSLVKPGDVVRRDQVLGRLDGREVRWEMAGLAADEGRAAKSRDVSMAANKVAAAQIDALEMERLSHKRRLLEYRAVHLDIKSPIDGVIISGDLQRSEGIPVSIGQALYEIAPLGCMVAEIAIRDDDRSLVEPRQNVTIRLDAYPGKSWAGRLTRINPRAEERDDDNVFIGEVVLDSANGELRPGMKGRSVIDGPQYPLAWLLLRTPWNAVFRWMGW
jgi:multidrug resistance efflux pump